MVVIYVCGVFGMLNADTETMAKIATSTIEKEVDYVTDELPVVICSDAAGMIVGAVGGIFVNRNKNNL